jgi:hypothetical protein
VHLLVACCVVGEVVQQQALRPRLLAQVEQHQLLQLVLPADPSRQSDTRSGGTQDSSDSSNSQQRTCCKQSMQSTYQLYPLNKHAQLMHQATLTAIALYHPG